MQSNYPLLYQMNTRVRLTELSKRLGRRATLNDISDNELDFIAAQGFEWIWLLSVWTTGPAGRTISRTNPNWRVEFEQTLPDLNEEDIAGSGFAVADYSVDPSIGGNGELANLRARMAQRNLKLMLDFVPNHTALDHGWAASHPEYYVRGTDQDLSDSAGNYVRLQTSHGERVFAHGRDPYFPGWPDTLQLDYSNPATQQAMTAELVRVSKQCDGVRCDMAMLILPDVFQRTWNKTMSEFWPGAVNEVRKQNPDFCFMAEVYWDREWTLQQQGFNYTYDKRLYDRLREGNARSVRGHLLAPIEYQKKMARFMENHDEPRAASAFPLDMHKAAAIISFLSPGLRFFHQGQFEGRMIRISPHLVRAPEEPVNQELKQFYSRLLNMLAHPVFHGGEWKLLSPQRAWETNWTEECFIAFEWQLGEAHMLVVVNYAPHQSQCYLRFNVPRSTTLVHLEDLMNQATYDRSSMDIHTNGLFLDMAAWQFHVFAVSCIHSPNIEGVEELQLCVH